MGRYKDAAKFFEMAPEKFNYTSINEVAALIKLASCYEKLEENDLHTSTTTRLFGLYYGVRNALLEFPEPINISENIIQEIFIDLSRFKGADLHLKFEYSGDSEQYSRYKLVNVALRLLHYLDEIRNYTAVVKLGNILKNSIKSPGHSLTIDLSLLVGKAKMLKGNLFDGMNEIELALQRILEHPVTDAHTKAQKALACSLLIPRLVYIETCYQVHIALTDAVESAVTSFIWLLFSSYPMSVPVARNGKSTQSSLKVTDTNALEVHIGGPLGVLVPSWLFQNIFQEWLNPIITDIKGVIMKIYNITSKFFELLMKLMNICLCTVIIWAKLMLYYVLCLNTRQRQKLCVAMGLLCLNVFVEIFLYICAIVLFVGATRNLSIIRHVIRRMKDPRYMYVDGTFYTGLIDCDLI